MRVHVFVCARIRGCVRVRVRKAKLGDTAHRICPQQQLTVEAAVKGGAVLRDNALQAGSVVGWVYMQCYVMRKANCIMIHVTASARCIQKRATQRIRSGSAQRQAEVQSGLAAAAGPAGAPAQRPCPRPGAMAVEHVAGGQLGTKRSAPPPPIIRHGRWQ